MQYGIKYFYQFFFLIIFDKIFYQIGYMVEDKIKIALLLFLSCNMCIFHNNSPFWNKN